MHKISYLLQGVKIQDSHKRALTLSPFLYFPIYLGQIRQAEILMQIYGVSPCESQQIYA